MTQSDVAPEDENRDRCVLVYIESELFKTFWQWLMSCQESTFLHKRLFFVYKLQCDGLL